MIHRQAAPACAALCFCAGMRHVVNAARSLARLAQLGAGAAQQQAARAQQWGLRPASAAARGGPARPAPGDSLATSRTFDAAAVAAFLAATGDANPLHVDHAAAAAAGLGAPILPGMLMASLFPGLVGSAYPGALYLTQSLRFRQHAHVGLPVTATVTVKKASGSRVTFDTVCQAPDGRVLVEGEALALIRAGAAGAGGAGQGGAAQGGDGQGRAAAG